MANELKGIGILKDKRSPELSRILDTLESVSKAIVSVINIDLTIIDQRLNRIFATGKYVGNIGDKVDKSCTFAYALRRGEKFIIENPRQHEACKECSTKKNCKEYGQVCCPINVDGEIIGIIGLIAFNETQKKRIVCNKENLLDFLSRMSDLIAAKIREIRKTDEIILMAQELETLLNSMDIGVISTDSIGRIIRYNTISKDYFNLEGMDHRVNNITMLVKGIDILLLKEKKSTIRNKEFNYSQKGLKFRGIYNVKPITVEEEVIGFIFTFNKMNEIIKVVNDIAGSHMITTFEDIIGESREINQVKEYALRISKGTSTVLLQGESGTGKELFARAIHYESTRKNQPFIAINCTAIPENLIESELFGYEEGAFTGARKGGKIGKFELANKGTIFLDEIGDMPIHMQTKLLRVLQENMISRVGGNKLVPINVRVIAATNKHLEEKVREGEFREDLFYRLNVIPITLPPLRERPVDIKIMAQQFLYNFNNKLDRNIMKIDDGVFQLFMTYGWPGNVRELENVVEYAVNMASNSIIDIKNLPKRLINTDSPSGHIVDDAIMPIKDLEKREIIKAFRKYGHSKGGVEKVAKDLEISRATLYRKIKAYHIK